MDRLTNERTGKRKIIQIVKYKGRYLCVLRIGKEESEGLWRSCLIFHYSLVTWVFTLYIKLKSLFLPKKDDLTKHNYLSIATSKVTNRRSLFTYPLFDFRKLMCHTRSLTTSENVHNNKKEGFEVFQLTITR